MRKIHSTISQTNKLSHSSLPHYKSIQEEKKIDNFLI